MQTVLAIAAAWLLCFAVVGAVSVAGLGQWRLKRLARRRRGEGFRTFAAGLANEGLSAEVLGTLYWYLQSSLGVPNFPVRADDRLRETLGMGPDAVEDALVTVGALTGCAEITRPYGMAFGPVLTAGDLVRFLQPLAPAARRPHVAVRASDALRRIA